MESSYIKALKHTKDKVKFVLENYPETRNNDNLLCTTYWRIIDRIEDIHSIQFATGTEVIRRARQSLNEKGLFLATDPKILSKRKRYAKEVRLGIKII
ncbi:MULTISPECIES: hypothetical protein [Bacillus]|jgi:hypothetical protein|uniref:Uncharacterized protein n=1 Tax=Bacillus cereus (strain G9842) TaxID=405531 RepID=B7IZM7_BACC2|nr:MULTISPECIES: hypothetical protein [Bacillus]ACK98712.1 hypothetical protein BCG9842_A0034 [Bacillus cereus G9842]KUF34423.1 hypothetical protein AMR94_02165 [Bacillus sp. G3(2015)]MCU5508213.1 hypothetical protein [Bacillus cereus]MDA1951607.1 hypothetical protein [Bacillus cereus]MDA2417059.1 hypothetical protein [Bacillus cereus]